MRHPPVAMVPCADCGTLFPSPNPTPDSRCPMHSRAMRRIQEQDRKERENTARAHNAGAHKEEPDPNCGLCWDDQ